MFIIQDWAGNHLFINQSFDTFEDGWEFIYANVTDESVWQDLYVVPKP